jgi:hypothetical protein
MVRNKGLRTEKRCGGEAAAADTAEIMETAKAAAGTTIRFMVLSWSAPSTDPVPNRRHLGSWARALHFISSFGRAFLVNSD